jgi:hypothetical protein
VDAQTVTRIWQQAIAQGVIPSVLQKDLQSTVQAFQNLSAARALDARALPGSSTLKEMLQLALGSDATRQQQFADLWARHRSDLPTFWNEVQRVFGEATTKRLQLDGQLGYLTLSNAPMISRLHAAQRQPLSSTLDLVRRGYYRAAQWTPLMDGTIPASIPGNTPEEKRGNYAEMLAAQVRLSFPTAVVAEMVGASELPLTADTKVRDGVRTFLSAHQGKFEIGIHPIEQYLARNRLDNQVDPLVKEQIKRLQRVYQITPNDRAMAALLQRNLDSAYQIVRYNEAAFVQTFKDQFGGEEPARLTYAKAQQVHNAVLNIATSYLTARLAPALGSDIQAPLVNPASTSIAQQEAPHTSDVIAYPTLEKLFGSMDFCACEHCRSILSPAAYLVDLLHFLDHPVSNGTANPQEVLLERRPDIQHLQLTCENTNTPLPYIDVVNETLEYFVAQNLSLGDYTGHDTDDRVTTEELMASPQFVNEAAYNTLKIASFPPPLPFHRPLESLRRTFEKFEVPLHEAMETLRTDDAIERANAATYGWRDILMEQLALSRAEYSLLTQTLPQQNLPNLYGYPETSDEVVRADLSNAKVFARRMGISYEDLIEILKTRFVNPHSTLLPKLERLGVPFATLKTLKESPQTGKAWLALLPDPLLNASPYGGNIEAWVKNPVNYANFMSLITLTTPIVPWAALKEYRLGDCVRPTSPPAGSTTFYECTTPGTSAAGEPKWPTEAGEIHDGETVVWTSRSGLSACSFDTLRFRYTDPDKLTQDIRSFEFVRLLRFIRLWKKLGWTIEQTDKAITALYPSNQIPNDPNDDSVNLQRLDNGFLVMLPRLGVAMQVMHRLSLHPQKDVLELLACWSPIDTHGVNALYHKMFLSQPVSQQDAAFADDGYGNFLKNNAQKVIAHAETLRAAFTLTAAEFSQIVAALGFNANTPLTLDTISAIYRRGWLARALRLSVQEFLLLTQYTGLDPFTPPDPANPPIMRLVDLVQALRATSLKPTQALYLLWNQDISGTSAPTDGQITDFARLLRADFDAIERAFAIVDDPNGDITRARMALVYGSDATDFFFGLLDNTVTVNVPYSHPKATLEQSILDAGSGRIGYNDFHKRLSYSGVLSIATRDALKAALRGSATFATAVDALYKANQDVFRPFFTRYPELEPLYTKYVTSNEPPEQKRTALLAHFLPELKRRRKRQQALIAISAAAGTESTFTSAILDDVTILHAAGDTTRVALDDLTAMETPALSGESFWSATLTGSVKATAKTESIIPIPEKIWNGYLEVLENDVYKIAVEVDVSAPENTPSAKLPTEPDGVESVTLTLGGHIVPLVQNGTLWESDPVSLAAGTLYPVVLQVKTVANTFTVRWKTTGRGWEVIPTRYLYPAALIDCLRSTYIRFLKAASLATGLKLTTNETTHFVAHADYHIRGEGWLNALTVSGGPDTTTAQALRDALVALLEFARIKARLSPDDERLLAVLQDPSTALPNGDSLLLTLTRWESSSLNALLARFGKPLTHMDAFRRVYDAASLATTVGISASTLITATTNEPDGTTVRNLQAALRARYHEAAWLNVLKPMNDDLRGRQRDALVAYILQQFAMRPAASHIDTPDKLFEYFLMDVQMEPCMQTSRIRHALSSVQLFIERCLMNLEPRVLPEAFSTDQRQQWAWMKRYRVWEANRKVFLWPENWLEPELRDDQSPFFKETMSELLQSDITEDTAATAMLTYLSRLEEVAKLEPCGMHYVPGGAGTADDIVHVVARTAGAGRKYYYRHRDHDSWTPWEQIKLDIEDNPVVPAVWDGRLLLFWLKILKQASPAESPLPQNVSLTELNTSNINTSAPTITVQAVLCWSEYYNGKWQPTKTSDIDHPITLSTPTDNPFDRSNLGFRIGIGPQSGTLRVSIVSEPDSSDGSTAFVLYNTHSLPVPEQDKHFVGLPRRFTGSPELFSIDYSFTGDFSNNKLFSRTVLDMNTDTPIPFTIIQPSDRRQTVYNAWKAPFFFADSRHVFYVTTTEKPMSLSAPMGYGSGISSIQQAVALPPLVLHRDRLLDGGVDTDRMTRFVTEDINIRIGISTSASVRYSDQEIGPAGVLSNGQKQ